MTPLEAATAIANTIRDEWTGAHVVFPKEHFTPGDEPYIQLTIRGLPPRQTTHGTVNNRITDQRGLLSALVRFPVALSDGMGPAFELAQDFRDLFQGRSIGADPIHFDHCSPDDLGLDGAWSLASVAIPFRYQERT